MNACTTNVSFKSRIFKPGFVLNGEYKNCSFSLAGLNGTRIIGKFENCSFVNAEFRHAALVEAIFINCNFLGSKFKETQIRACTFDACDFGGASFFTIAGVSTSTFKMNCKGLMHLSGDLAVQLISNKGVYSVIPKDLTTMHKIKEHCPTVGRIPQPVFTPGKVVYPGEYIKNLPGEIINNMAYRTNYTPKVDELVEPEHLPEVDHYRSPPSKILQSNKPTTKQKYVHSIYDEEDYDYSCGYTMAGHGRYGHGNWQPYVYNEQYRYGYMSNGVLECSDIEELKACQS